MVRRNLQENSAQPLRDVYFDTPTLLSVTRVVTDVLKLFDIIALIVIIKWVVFATKNGLLNSTDRKSLADSNSLTHKIQTWKRKPISSGR